ncbi:MAG TPA: hypothetical protein PKO18_09330 [Chitinophagales bacterium]|nr:hypothetical protein [Chitinophagales bacterium]HNL85428.1 hypothetical protein [Chitinophagales bacterium]
MRIIVFAIITILFIVSTHPASARNRYKRPKSCVSKVLLPGHSKPMKCNKARKVKNAYF